MLKTIHDMISAQKQCMEAASLILEAGKSLDDLIVLGEAAPGAVPPPSDGADPIEPGADGPEGTDPTEEITPSEEPAPGEEPLDTPPAPEGNEELLPVPGAEDLPEPVGKQTGETPISADDDLLNMQVNLGSNTLRDVLPQPPANAADAIGDEDDIMHTRVDAGFGGDEGPDGGGDDFTDPTTPPVPESDVPTDPGPGAEPASPEEPTAPVDNGGDGSGPETTPSVEEESGDLLSEAITMDDGGAAPAGGDQNAQPADGGDGITEPPVDTSTPAPEGGDTGTEPAAEEPAPENDVTAAVKDKVAEVTGPTPGTSTTTEELLNKLSNVTKNIEDIKKGLVASGIGTVNV